MNSPLSSRRDGWIALGLSVSLLLIYFANGPFLIHNDALPNLYLPVQILEHQEFLFHPSEVPFMFRWSIQSPTGPRLIAVPAWTAEFEDLRAEKLLRLEGAEHFLRPTLIPDAYVGTYGVGAGLTALPLFAAAKCLGVDLQSPLAVCWIGKLAAALSTSASAGLVYLTARRFSRWTVALAASVVFGLGTSVWALASQTLVQHGPAIFYLSLGAWFLFRPAIRVREGFGGGIALGLAFLCRPTNAIAVILLAPWFRLRPLVGYWCGAAPLVLFQIWLNVHLLGSPTLFPQTAHAAAAIIDTPAEVGMWATPFWVGFAGLLVSPSRGLLIYSPIMALAALGAWSAFTQEQWRPLRGAVLFSVALLLLNSKWFQWFGGWDFSYRLLLDSTPFLSLLLGPAFEGLFQTIRGRVLVAVLAGWSIAVQALGAAAFTLDAWNNREAYIVRAASDSPPSVVFDPFEAEILARSGAQVARGPVDVGRVEFRGLFWSWRNSQLVYLLRHAADLAPRRWNGSLGYTANYGRRPDESTDALLAQIFRILNRASDAERMFRRGLSKNPDDLVLLVGLGRLLLESGRKDEAAKLTAGRIDRVANAPSAWQLLGDVERALGNSIQAAAHFEKGAKAAEAKGDASAFALAAASAATALIDGIPEAASLYRAHQWATAACQATQHRDPASLESLVIVLAKMKDPPNEHLGSRQKEIQRLAKIALDLAKQNGDGERAIRLQRLLAESPVGNGP